MDMDRLTAEYRRQFYDEAREILERLGDDILRAEADPEDRTLLDAIFRGIHTIKGSAGSFELTAVADLAHQVEGVLGRLRDGRITLSPETADAILAGADGLLRLVETSAAGGDPRPDPALMSQLAALGRSGSDETESAPDQTSEVSKFFENPGELNHCPDPGPEISEAGRRALAEAAGIGLSIFRVRLRFTSDHLENGYDPAVFLANLRASSTAWAVGAGGAGVPPLDRFSPFALYLSPTLYVATSLSADEIRDLTFDPALVSVARVRMDDPGEGAAPIHELVEGAEEMLEAMEKAVIDYETSGSRESLNRIFRAVHSVKGDADLMGLREITVFAHALETLLDRLRAGTIDRSFALVDVILQSVDFLRHAVSGLGSGVRVPELPPVFETLKAYAAVRDDLARRTDLLSGVPADLAEAFVEQVGQYRSILAAHAGEMPAELSGPAYPVVRRALTDLASASTVVGLGALASGAVRARTAWEAGDPGAFAEAVAKLSGFMESLTGEGVGGSRPAPDASFHPDSGSATSSSGVGSRSMRVDEKKVDRFTNLVSELLIARNAYSHLMEGLARRQGEVLDGETVRGLKENLHLFSRLTRDIHHGVMALRMVPVSKVLGKLNRTVRDISRRQSKSIRLLTGGGEIEIDKTVADVLTDPLIHLVRNACDHGIESPEVRTAAGKSAEGTVVISAAQDGGRLTISVVDDGRGVDLSALRSAAEAAGHPVADDDGAAVRRLAFLPGLSTRSDVSEISGRGVGLDAVKAAVERLGGTVSLTSTPGKGTEVVLSIPTTLGIDAVLLVEAEGQTFALPMAPVRKTLKLPAGRLRRSGGGGMLFAHRGTVLPAIHLGALLWGKAAPAPEGNGLIPVVILESGGRTVGLMVDRMTRRLEVAVKPLPGRLAGSPGWFGGVTIMGDGSVMLVLNPDTLV